MQVDAFPLQWPAHWPRTDRPQRARFDTTMAAARDGLIHELNLMGVRSSNIVISSDIPLRMDGLPKANRRVPNDPGVAVYFVRDGHQLCIPCDKWDRIQDNMQAIRKTIEALRGLERWGAKHMVDAAFQGFEALPAQSQHGWWEVLDVERWDSDADVTRAYRMKAQQEHPDVGGDIEQFHQVQAAYEEFKRERGIS